MKKFILVGLSIATIVLLITPFLYVFLFIDAKVSFVNRIDEDITFSIGQGLGWTSIRLSPSEVFTFRPNGDHSFKVRVSKTGDNEECYEEHDLCCEMKTSDCQELNGVIPEFGLRVIYYQNRLGSYSLSASNSAIPLEAKK